MNSLARLLAFASLSGLALATSASATAAMEYVRVGNPNNAADPTTSYGAVDHAYWIGKYEVTNAQYAEFLNAKGQSNAHEIYNSSMAAYGITLSGSSGSYSYTVSSALANRPVVFVSWFDAARFANWMGNGQGNGDMETGAYTLNGATSGIITANAGAQVYIPSENEWYKAAYFSAASRSYSIYPNVQNSISTAYANYGSSASTNVGTYSGYGSYYGTFDQGGNVWEWNAAVIGSSRGLRGGAWYDSSFFSQANLLSSSDRFSFDPSLASGSLGFRVAATSIDTDSDGLDDLAETNTGIYVSPTNTGTNPNSADSDGDGVPDGLEVKEKTSPVDATKFNSFSKNLIGYWPFDSIQNDQSGKNKGGQLFNSPTYDVDRYGNSGRSLKMLIAQSFSSTDAIGITGNQEWTVAHWMKVTKNPVWPNGVAWSMGSGYQQMASFYYHPYHPTQMAFDGFDVVSTFSPLPLEVENKWIHVVVSYKNTIDQIKFYVDGKEYSGQLSYVDPNFSLNLANSLFSINPIPNGNDAIYDDVRVYNRALSPVDAVALYRSEVPQFQIIPGSFTWQQAKADAEARGGRLAMLNTQAKIDEANAFLTASGTQADLFIGLADLEAEGNWRWITGESLSSANWNLATNEPNNGNGTHEEDGAQVRWSWNWAWNDVSVSTISGYILEFPKQTLIVTTPTHGAITGAGEYDPGTSATLTAVPDAGYAFTAWTGDASGTTNPLTLTMDADKAVSATFAADLTDTDTDGLTAYDEVTLYHTDPTKADSDNDGLTDGYELGIGRFSVVSGTRTWAQAKAHAETQGGTLATFANQDEWNLAMQSIGTDALLDVGGLWIGATDEAVEGTWAWVTGEPFVFTLWETGQPDNSNNSDYAAVAGDLGGTSGKWYDYRATTSRDGYILESGYSTNPSDADSDDDGLLDGAERTAGSNPFNADTDSDTLTDAEEVNLTLTNPTRADSNSNGTNDAADDQDGDGVSNLAEIRTHGTNPVLADTDSDGISDGVELAMTQNFYKLVAGSFNQAQAAADAATKRGRLASLVDLATYTSVVGKARRTSQGYLWVGLSDAAAEGTWKWVDGTTLNFNRWLSGQPDGGSGENFALIMENASTLADGVAAFVAAGYLYERTGLDPLNPDTDGDGLNDGAEQNTHSTNPFNDDSDSDGLLDGAEVLTHLSNPNKADTDDDGLPDKQEVETYLTNPAAKDSDSDGFDDLFEINTGFNPRLASSTPDAVSTIRTSVEFRFNAANGVSYRIEASIDLINWASVEDSIIGTGGVVTRFYSIENQPKRYFRVRRN